MAKFNDKTQVLSPEKAVTAGTAGRKVAAKSVPIANKSANRRVR